MTNAQPTNRWFYHFSFDEFYVLPLSILFMLIETVILVIAVIFTCKKRSLRNCTNAYLDLLRSRNMLHPTFKLFLNSLTLDLCGLVALWIHYDRYADNGKGFPLLKSCGLLLR
jgi:hypothetical protein